MYILHAVKKFCFREFLGYSCLLVKLLVFTLAVNQLLQTVRMRTQLVREHGTLAKALSRIDTAEVDCTLTRVHATSTTNVVTFRPSEDGVLRREGGHAVCSVGVVTEALVFSPKNSTDA